MSFTVNFHAQSTIRYKTHPITGFQIEGVIIDSNYDLEGALSGLDIPAEIKKTLTLVEVEYYSFDGKLHKGQVVINKQLAEGIKEIFEVIKQKKFPVESVIPAAAFGWSDEESMDNNNTSAFNYRKIPGTNKLSLHALGKAIDINPQQNPQFKRGKTIPEGAQYNPSAKGTILRDSFLVREFLKRGWMWGGYWRRTKDYQHFEYKN